MGIWSAFTQVLESCSTTNEQDLPNPWKGASWIWVSSWKSLLKCRILSAHFWQHMWVEKMCQWQHITESFLDKIYLLSSMWTAHGTVGWTGNFPSLHSWGQLEHSPASSWGEALAANLIIYIRILFVAFANLPWKITSAIKCNADRLRKLWWMSCHLYDSQLPTKVSSCTKPPGLEGGWGGTGNHWPPWAHKNTWILVSEMENAQKLNRSIIFLCPWTVMCWKISIRIRLFCVQLCCLLWSWQHEKDPKVDFTDGDFAIRVSSLTLGE